MNSKMLLAPVLAVVSVLLIAGAVVMFLPLNQPDQTKAVQITSANSVPLPTTAPQAAASAADISILPVLIMLGVAAVIVGLAVFLLFFRREPQ